MLVINKIAILFTIAAFLLFHGNVAAQLKKDQGKLQVLPLPIVVRSIETGWSFGAAISGTFHMQSATDSGTRTSNMQALSLYSVRHQLVLAINGSIYFPGEKYILNQQFSFSSFPDKFWGLGKQTSEHNVEDYKYKQLYIYLHPQRLIGRNLFVGVRYEFQRVWQVQYKTGGLFDEEMVIGRHGYHVSGAGASLTYDTRNNAFAPDKGLMLQCYVSHFNNLLGSDYDYTNYVIDARKFLTTYKKQVLAIQLYGFFNSGEVPLRSLAAFGGANSMRGYYSGRYRDLNMAIFQTEYRMPVYKRFGAVVFGGIGNVARQLDDFTFSHTKYSWGGGIRFALSKVERLNLRLDYGFGKGDARGFYFQLGEAF